MTLRLTGSPRLIMLDVDGTLAPIAPRPELAMVPNATRRLIAKLVGTPGVMVSLVSGRAAADARRMVDVDGVWVIGNHGAEVMRPDGGIEVEPAAEAFAGEMARVAAALAPVVAGVRGAVLENKVWTLTVHFRLVEPAAVPGLMQAVGNIARAHGLTVRDGKAVIEVRPPVSVDKGTAVVALARRLGALEPGASLLFAGDDVTDEDAFRALRAEVPGAVTIRVGEQNGEWSSAEFGVEDPEALVTVLEECCA